jgi:hypothetical protein
MEMNYEDIISFICKINCKNLSSSDITYLKTLLQKDDNIFSILTIALTKESHEKV